MSRIKDLLSVALLLLSAGGALGKNCGNSQHKVCVARILCENGAVITDGHTLFSYRSLVDGNEGCDTTEVCCSIADKVNSPVVEVDVATPTECGHRNEKGLHYTMTDAANVAQVGEFPWMVALLLKADSTYLGAGTLIRSDVVLTAAHVVANLQAGQLIVRAGEWDFKIETELNRHVNVDVRLIERHSDFQVTTGANNLALLFLTTPLKTQPHICPACLPTANKIFDHTRCLVSGWGKMTFESNSYMHILKKVEVPVVDNALCQQQLRRSILGSSFVLNPSFLCAGGEQDKDACTGDGGAALVCPLANDRGRYEQAGIVNWGVGCGAENIPAIYTNVALFRQWIDNKIAEKSTVVCN
ncbi:phenoloxidase-activating factor 2-like [Drosophila guanche]|uniref:Phenoloxidase-activating factor 2 n=1 Tax=Drosophila guanche TaxID=7266 RepID=A0A3B0JJ29_DROGU|nr:phenoloxidase-activating factor 2-like [Drosophila guanche]SPP82424.1 blast:Serine proteinase stubble [Drosophila guanche]